MLLLKSITQYFFVDWLGMLFIVLAIYFIGEKQRKGFLLGMLGSISWLIFSVMVESFASILLNVVMIGLYLRGYYKWSRHD